MELVWGYNGTKRGLRWAGGGVTPPCNVPAVLRWRAWAGSSNTAQATPTIATLLLHLANAIPQNDCRRTM